MSIPVILFLIISLLMFMTLIGAGVLNCIQDYPDTVNRITYVILLPVCLAATFIAQAILQNILISYMIFLSGIILLYILLNKKLIVPLSFNRLLGFLFLFINEFFFIMFIGALNRANKANPAELAGYWNGFVVLPVVFFLLLSIIAAMFILKLETFRAALLFVVTGLLISFFGIYNIMDYLPSTGPDYQGEPLFGAGLPAHIAEFSIASLLIVAGLLLFYSRRSTQAKDKQ